jgi:hypothetical protein
MSAMLFCLAKGVIEWISHLPQHVVKDAHSIRQLHQHGNALRIDVVVRAHDMFGWGVRN